MEVSDFGVACAAPWTRRAGSRRAARAQRRAAATTRRSSPARRADIHQVAAALTGRGLFRSSRPRGPSASPRAIAEEFIDLVLDDTSDPRLSSAAHAGRGRALSAPSARPGGAPVPISPKRRPLFWAEIVLLANASCKSRITNHDPRIRESLNRDSRFLVRDSDSGPFGTSHHRSNGPDVLSSSICAAVIPHSLSRMRSVCWPSAGGAVERRRVSTV